MYNSTAQITEGTKIRGLPKELFTLNKSQLDTIKNRNS